MDKLSNDFYVFFQKEPLRRYEELYNFIKNCSEYTNRHLDNFLPIDQFCKNTLDIKDINEDLSFKIYKKINKFFKKVQTKLRFNKFEFKGLEFLNEGDIFLNLNKKEYKFLKKIEQFEYNYKLENKLEDEIKEELNVDKNKIFLKDCRDNLKKLSIISIYYQILIHPAILYYFPINFNVSLVRYLSLIDNTLNKNFLTMGKISNFIFGKRKSKIFYKFEDILNENIEIIHTLEDIISLIGSYQNTFDLKLTKLYCENKNIDQVICHKKDYNYSLNFYNFLKYKTECFTIDMNDPDNGNGPLSIALKNKFSVIKGEAGTGKTYVIEKLYNLLKNIFDVYIISFTGKSIDNIINRLKCDDNIMTIDKFILSRIEFKKNVIIIIDEISMLSLEKMHKLIKLFVYDRIQLIMLGDINQLPPVDYPINIFHIFNNCWEYIPNFKLEKNYRVNSESGSIIKNAQLFTIEKFFRFSYCNISVDKHFDIIQRPPKKDTEEYNSIFLNFYNDNSEFLNNQIICFTNSTKDNINKLIQKNFFNKNVLKIYTPLENFKNFLFKIGDKIICTKNYKKDDIFVSNGSIGVLENIYCDKYYFCLPKEHHKLCSDKNKIKKCDYECNNFFKVTTNDNNSFYMCKNRLENNCSSKNILEYVCSCEKYEADIHFMHVRINNLMLKIPIFFPFYKSKFIKSSKRKILTSIDFDLSYCITCHKYQGSQALNIMYIKEGYSKNPIKRSHIYTGITRSQSYCIIFNPSGEYHVSEDIVPLESFSYLLETNGKLV